MGYIESSLTQGERVIYKTKLHWVNLLMLRIIKWLFNEMAITNRRLIYKEGFISRRTTELNLTRIEAVGVEQGVIGRILGFGTVVITGSGGTDNRFPWISNPMEFRRQINQIPFGNTAGSVSTAPVSVVQEPPRKGDQMSKEGNVSGKTVLGWILVPYVMVVLYALKHQNEIFVEKNKEYLTKFAMGAAWALVVIGMVVFSGNDKPKSSPQQVKETPAAVKADPQAKDYARALAMQKNGELEKAERAFKRLEGYKDSATRVQAIQQEMAQREAALEKEYTEAVNLFEAGKYEQAKPLFAKLQKYKDSPAYMEKCDVALSGPWGKLVASALELKCKKTLLSGTKCKCAEELTKGLWYFGEASEIDDEFMRKDFLAKQKGEQARVKGLKQLERVKLSRGKYDFKKKRYPLYLEWPVYICGTTASTSKHGIFLEDLDGEQAQRKNWKVRKWKQKKQTFFIPMPEAEARELRDEDWKAEIVFQPTGMHRDKKMVRCTDCEEGTFFDEGAGELLLIKLHGIRIFHPKNEDQVMYEKIY